MAHDEHGNDAEKSPNLWTQKGFIASAVILAVLVTLGIVLTITGPSGPPGQAQPTTPPTEPATTMSPSAASSDSICGLPAGDQTVPSSAVTATKWELVGTMAVPTGPETYGPGQISDDGLRSCFARSPIGALFATANIIASTAVPELRQPVVNALGAQGPERDIALRIAAEEDAPATTGVQIVGFSFLNYDGDTATIDVAIRTTPSDGSVGYAHSPVTLRWEDGDWKVVFSSDGSLGAGTGALPDLTGYVPWAGA